MRLPGAIAGWRARVVMRSEVDMLVMQSTSSGPRLLLGVNGRFLTVTAEQLASAQDIERLYHAIVALVVNTPASRARIQAAAASNQPGRSHDAAKAFIYGMYRLVFGPRVRA